MATLWILENGSLNCIPDNIEFYADRAAAVENAETLFDYDPSAIENAAERAATAADWRGMKRTLHTEGSQVYYFNTRNFGADYVEVRAATAAELCDYMQLDELQEVYH